MANPGERHLAAELRGIGLTSNYPAEWKTQTRYKGVSFGFNDHGKSMKENENHYQFSFKETFITGNENKSSFSRYQRKGVEKQRNDPIFR